MFVDDDAPEAVADDVRRVAAFAAEDRDLRGKDVSLVAVEGQPADFADRVVLGSSGAKVMAKVAAIVGGSGAEDAAIGQIGDRLN